MMPEDELDKKATMILTQLRPQIDRAMLAVQPGGPEVTIVAGAFYLSVLQGLAENERRLIERCVQKLSKLLIEQKSTTAQV